MLLTVGGRGVLGVTGITGETIGDLPMGKGAGSVCCCSPLLCPSLPRLAYLVLGISFCTGRQWKYWQGAEDEK